MKKGQKLPLSDAFTYSEEKTGLEWLCSCGHYEESGLHCTQCGAQPPWGCGCSDCQDQDVSDDPDCYPYPDIP